MVELNLEIFKLGGAVIFSLVTLFHVEKDLLTPFVKFVDFVVKNCNILFIINDLFFTLCDLSLSFENIGLA